MEVTRVMLSVVVVSLILGWGIVEPPEERVWTFEGDAPGSIARGFVGEVGRWEVVDTPEGRVLAQKAVNPDQTFNVALVEGVELAEVQLSVRVKAIEGVEDQGGGLVWRARDGRNYYIVRYNPLEDNFRVYKVTAGVRTLFQNAPAPKKEGWRTVRVAMVGDHIACFLDGSKLLDVHDSTFPGPGRVGVWSKADARSYFDDLTVQLGQSAVGR